MNIALAEYIMYMTQPAWKKKSRYSDQEDQYRPQI